MLNNNAQRLTLSVPHVCSLHFTATCCAYRSFAYNNSTITKVVTPFSLLLFSTREISLNLRKRRGLRRREVPPSIVKNYEIDEHSGNPCIAEDVTMKGSTIATITATCTHKLHSQSQLPLQSSVSSSLPTSEQSSPLHTVMVNSGVDVNVNRGNRNSSSSDNSNNNSTAKSNITYEMEMHTKNSVGDNRKLAEELLKFNEKKNEELVNILEKAEPNTLNALQDENTSRRKLLQQMKKQNLEKKQQREDTFHREQENDVDVTLVRSHMNKEQTPELKAENNLSDKESSRKLRKVQKIRNKSNKVFITKSSNVNNINILDDFDKREKQVKRTVVTKKNGNDSNNTTVATPETITSNANNIKADNFVEDLCNKDTTVESTTDSDKDIRLNNNLLQLSHNLQSSEENEHTKQHYQDEKSNEQELRQQKATINSRHARGSLVSDKNNNKNNCETNKNEGTTLDATMVVRQKIKELTTASNEDTKQHNMCNNVKSRRSRSLRGRSNASRMQRREVSNTITGNALPDIFENNREMERTANNIKHKNNKVIPETNVNVPKVKSKYHKSAKKLTNACNNKKFSEGAEERINAAVRAVLTKEFIVSNINNNNNNNNNSNSNNNKSIEDVQLDLITSVNGENDDNDDDKQESIVNIVNNNDVGDNDYLHDVQTSSHLEKASMSSSCVNASTNNSTTTPPSCEDEHHNNNNPTNANKEITNLNECEAEVQNNNTSVISNNASETFPSSTLFSPSPLTKSTLQEKTSITGKLRKSASARIQEHILRKRLLSKQRREMQHAAQKEQKLEELQEEQEAKCIVNKMPESIQVEEEEELTPQLNQRRRRRRRRQKQEQQEQEELELELENKHEHLPFPKGNAGVKMNKTLLSKLEKAKSTSHYNNDESNSNSSSNVNNNDINHSNNIVRNGNSRSNGSSNNNISSETHSVQEKTKSLQSLLPPRRELTANPLYYPDHREVVLDIFHQLAEINSALGERYKAQSYYAACESLKKNDNLMRLLPPNLIPLPTFVGELGDAATVSDNLTKRHNLISSEGVLPGVGSKLRGKIVEILRTGDLRELHSLEAKPLIRALRELTRVHGFGPRTAIAFYRYYGISTVEELKRYAAEHDTGERGTVGNKSSKDTHVQKAFKLTDAQRVGLQYYDEITERIPYAEGRLHEALLKIKVRKYLGKEYTLTICGSYRRKVPSSGDIDVLITRNLEVKDPHTRIVEPADGKTNYRSVNEVAPEDALATFVKCLTNEGYILASLAQGPTKFMGICRLRRSGVNNNNNNNNNSNSNDNNEKVKHTFTARRIDIRFVDAASYPAAMLYFTGSKNFNVIMRSEALKKNYILNEYGLFRNPTQSSEGIASLHEMISRLAKAHCYWSTNTINPTISQNSNSSATAALTTPTTSLGVDDGNDKLHNKVNNVADVNDNSCDDQENHSNYNKSEVSNVQINATDVMTGAGSEVSKKKRGKGLTPKQLREMRELVRKVDSLRVKVYDEQDVFDELEMEYVSPQDRNM